VFVIKNRVIASLLATLVITLLAPITSAVANGDTPATISISAIEGITPPVAGAIPVQFITPNNEYTGEVVWSNIVGDLDEGDTFTSLTHYKAEILITPKSGFTLDTSNVNFFTVADGTNVETDYFPEGGIFKGVVTAIFIPEAGDATDYLDETFGTNGYLNIKDFFGAAPLNDSNTAVGPIKVDRIAVDSQDRIVVLASFYTVDNQIFSVAGASGDDIGTGYKNTESIVMQQGNVRESSAAVAARTYRPTVANAQVTDWYLPSIGELWALEQTAAAVNTLLDHYWSSTESDTNTALYIDFNQGGESSIQKSYDKAVRPIRSGTLADASVGATGPGGGKIFYVMQGDTFNCGPTLSSTCNYLEAAPNGWSGELDDPFISWATGPIDNHILFRLNADGSYDTSFGVGGPSLRKVEGDTPKSHVLVTTTCREYTERLDLEIDSQNKILVMLSGSAEGIPDCTAHHNFLVRYTSVGVLDTSFGDGADGAIGTLTPQSGSPESLFSDFTVDALGRITVASLGYDADFDFLVQRFTPVGLLDLTFGPGNSPGSVFAEIAYPVGESPSGYRSIQIIAVGENGYMIAFTGVFINDEYEDVVFTQLIRLLVNGMLDQGFALPLPPFSEPDDPRSPFILPYFFVTDIAADGPTGFIISGTYFLDEEENIFGFPGLFGLMARVKFNGDTDTEFSPIVDDPWLTPVASINCFNTALLRNSDSNQSMIGVLVGDYCGNGSLKAFAPSGSFQGELSLGETPINLGLQPITQLESTVTGKLLVLSGTRPTRGALGLLLLIGFLGEVDPDWTEAKITRYALPELLIAPPSEPPAPTPPVVVYVAPTPVPYLKTLTTPKLNLKDDKLICTPGTYNAGYTLDGVVQGSTTVLFTPNTFTYNILINGIAQTSLAVTSRTSSHSWSMPTGSTGALVTCSVTVTANGLTNTDKSGDNTSGVSSALTTQSAAIATANANYAAALNANSKAYQKALVDNRAKWRSDVEKIRTDYYAERDRIKSLPSTRATRALASVALKAYTAAQKKSAVDYKASQPAAATARDAANRAALDAKTAAIAKANATYGTFIESIGYGVLIP
jgi:hypothetical protein